jgi:hypothetical protein
VRLKYKPIQGLRPSLSAVAKNHGYIGGGSAQNSYDNHSLNDRKNLSASPSGLACITISSVQKESLIMPQLERSRLNGSGYCLNAGRAINRTARVHIYSH